MRRAIGISIFIHCLALLLVFKNGVEKQKGYPAVMMVHLSAPPPALGIPNPPAAKAETAITPSKKAKTPEPPPKDARTAEINAKKKPKPQQKPKQNTNDETPAKQDLQESKSKGLPDGVQLGSEFGSARLDATGFDSPYYLNILFNKIRNQWENPYDGSNGITCTIYFVVDRNGDISDSAVEKSSGVTVYDQSALRAVLSAKAPPLPNQFGAEQLGIHLEFQFIPNQ
jgi:TonB family protein